jgi:glycosyltransferase involved in cell wall biosynthesis
MPRLFFVIDSLKVGGAQNQLLQLVRSLDKQKYKIAVCPVWPIMDFEKEFRNTGVEIVRTHKRFSFDMTEVFRLAKSMRRFKPDVVHTWLFTGSLWGRMASIFARVPVIISGERAVCPDEKKPAFILPVNRLLSHWTDVIVANSGVGIQVLKSEGYNPDKLRLIYNGVDLRGFSPANVNLYRSVIREKLGIDQNTFTLGSVGRLTEAKGYIMLLHVAKCLAEKGVDFKWLIIGTGEDQNKLEELASKLGICNYVSFLGQRFDIPQLLSTLDLFVLTSFWEGMPNVVLEAMATGLPVIATAAAGTVEVVDDGYTGILTPIGDMGLMTDNILKLFVDPHLRGNMGLSGRKRIEDEFSLENMVSRTTDLYHELMVRKKLVVE